MPNLFEHCRGAACLAHREIVKRGITLTGDIKKRFECLLLIAVEIRILQNVLECGLAHAALSVLLRGVILEIEVHRLGVRGRVISFLSYSIMAK